MQAYLDLCGKLTLKIIGILKTHTGYREFSIEIEPQPNFSRSQCIQTDNIIMYYKNVFDVSLIEI